MVAAVLLLLLCAAVYLSSRAQAVDNNARATSRSAFNTITGNAVVRHRGSGDSDSNYLCGDWGAAWRIPCKIRSLEQLADGASPWPPADTRMRWDALCVSRRHPASRWLEAKVGLAAAWGHLPDHGVVAPHL